MAGAASARGAGPRPPNGMTEEAWSPGGSGRDWRSGAANGRRRMAAARLRGGFESAAAAVGAAAGWRRPRGERGRPISGLRGSGGRCLQGGRRGHLDPCAGARSGGGAGAGGSRGCLGEGGVRVSACAPGRFPSVRAVAVSPQPGLTCPVALQELRGSDTELPGDRPAGPMGQVSAPQARLLAELLVHDRIVTCSCVFQVHAVGRRMSSPSRKAKLLAQSPGAACEGVPKREEVPPRSKIY